MKKASRAYANKGAHFKHLEMPIDQQQPEPSTRDYLSPGTYERAEDLEYPHAQIPVHDPNSAMPLILWSLGFVFGMLIFLTHLPLDPPRIDQLTMFTCDPLPRLPNLGNRFQSYSLNLRCKDDDQPIYQSTKNIPRSNQAAANACTKAGRQTQIWRMAPPSPYGSYVFQVACGNLIITDYKSRAANYVSTQQFVIVLASLVTLGGAAGLIFGIPRFRQRARAAR